MSNSRCLAAVMSARRECGGEGRGARGARAGDKAPSLRTEWEEGTWGRADGEGWGSLPAPAPTSWLCQELRTGTLLTFSEASVVPFGK